MNGKQVNEKAKKREKRRKKKKKNDAEKLETNCTSHCK